MTYTTKGSLPPEPQELRNLQARIEIGHFGEHYAHDAQRRWNALRSAWIHMVREPESATRVYQYRQRVAELKAFLDVPLRDPGRDILIKIAGCRARYPLEVREWTAEQLRFRHQRALVELAAIEAELNRRDQKAQRNGGVTWE